MAGGSGGGVEGESGDAMRMRVLFCTYKSAHKVGLAQREGRLGGHMFDLAIFDEAHHTATRTEAFAALPLHDQGAP